MNIANAINFHAASAKAKGGWESAYHRLEMETKILREAINKIAAQSIDDDPDEEDGYIYLDNDDTRDALERAVNIARDARQKHFTQ